MRKSFFLFLLPLLFLGCGEVNCPAFPEKFLGWFPIDIGAKMVYSNNTDSSSFQIIESLRSSPTSFKKSCDCECMATSKYTSDLSQNAGFQIAIGCSFNTESNIIFDLNFKNTNSDDQYSFQYNNSAKTYEYISHITDYTIGNQTFHNVAVLEKLTGYTFVKKIFMSPEKGLLGFVDENDKEWKLVE